MNTPSYNIFLEKAKRYCAGAERCEQDVRMFLRRKQADNETIDMVVDVLRAENFINDERYVRAFVRDKFKINRWGKYKILSALRQKNFEDGVISRIINEEIDENEYEAVLKDIVMKKKKMLNLQDTNLLKQKISNFALSKGFEPDIVKKIVESIMQ